MNFKKKIFFITIVLVGLLVLGCSPNGEDISDDELEKEDVAATVNGVNISKEDFENTVNRMVQSYEMQGFTFEDEDGEEMLEQIRNQAIDSLVKDEVLFQEAEKEGYDASEEDIQEQLELLKDQFPSEDDFNTALQENNLTELDVTDMIARDIKIEQFVESKIKGITVDEEEVKEMYDQYKEQFEASKEEADEAQIMPDYEEVKSQLEMQIRQQKEQAYFMEMMEDLMEQNEIDIYIYK